MRNPLIKFLKKYLYFTKRDRNATVVLIILIVSVIVANEVIKHLPSKSDYDYFRFAKEFEEWKKNQLTEENNSKFLFTFNPNTISKEELDSLMLPDFVIKNLLSYRNAGGKFSEPADLRKIYGMNDSVFRQIEGYILIPKEREIKPAKNLSKELDSEGTFDPNTSDGSTLKYFGFNQFQTENLIGYREKGGVFYLPDDLLKIYGIDSVFLNKIRDHILIEKTDSFEKMKTKVPAVVELNSADSLELVQLEGIGPVFASRILKYRDLLGGYHSTSQLLEVYNFPEETYQEIKDYVKTDSTLIKKIRINFAQFSELIKHPYLDREKVNSILNYRDKNGTFKEVSQLRNIPGFDALTLEKIRPYISCR